MRENDCSPDLNDLNTLSLQDYEKIIEKNANQVSRATENNN